MYFIVLILMLVKQGYKKNLEFEIKELRILDFMLKKSRNFKYKT